MTHQDRLMTNQYEKRDAGFYKWLNEHHPAHSEFDHASSGEYKRWLTELREAFDAGWAARRKRAVFLT